MNTVLAFKTSVKTITESASEPAMMNGRNLSLCSLIAPPITIGSNGSTQGLSVVKTPANSDSSKKAMDLF